MALDSEDRNDREKVNQAVRHALDPNIETIWFYERGEQFACVIRKTPPNTTIATRNTAVTLNSTSGVTRRVTKTADAPSPPG
jgi:hypothetical protein